MRILVASDQWSPDTVGGSARVAADTARALADRGHSVTVVVPTRSGGRPAGPSVEDGVEVIRAIERNRLPQTLTDTLATRKAARAVAGRFDVLVGHQATTAVGLAAGRPDVPLALVYHASVVLEARYLRSRAEGAERLRLRAIEPVQVALERRAVGRARSILVLSAFSGGLVRGRYPNATERLHEVGGGVAAAFLDPPLEPAAAVRARHAIPEHAVFLLTTRRLEPRMGLEELLNALAVTDDARLVLGVTGDGPQRPALESLAGSLGLRDRVRFLGRVSEEDLRALYGAADLFVLPTVAYEGFGMSTVEALASGTPVLGTAVGATPEILSAIDDALVVPEATAASLADGIRRVLPLLTRELRDRCHEHARSRYAWSAAIVPWEAALRNAAIDASGVPGNL